jgi:hypothetical protein
MSDAHATERHELLFSNNTILQLQLKLRAKSPIFRLVASILWDALRCLQHPGHCCEAAILQVMSRTLRRLALVLF